MNPEELRLEVLRLANRLDLPPERITEEAERYLSFVRGYRFTETSRSS